MSDQIKEETLTKYIPRTTTQIESIKDSVISVIHEVKERGDNAIIKFTKNFDNVELSTKQIQVTDKEISEAYEKSDADLIKAIQYARKNLIKFHKAQVREDWFIEIEKGVTAGQIYRPLEVLGIYVPGGRVIYPSTVLMIAAPAYVAGIKEIIMCSPPQQDNKIASEILVAANEFGIKKIFKVGGAQAIAAMAYGTETVPKVDKIVGPGNIYVTEAKRQVFGYCDIDMLAGPSEVVIIANRYADVQYVKADLLAQAEHHKGVAILVTPSKRLVKAVKSEIEKGFVVLTKNMDEAIEVTNLLAPEHLQIMVKNPRIVLKKIKNAGAIFIGPYTPVTVGDYVAGPSHVLPTGGTARFFSGLGIKDFVKSSHIISYTKKALEEACDTIEKLTTIEGLPKHMDSVRARFK